MALSIFLVEAAEEVFEISAGLFLFLVCNLGQWLLNTTAALLLLQWQIASIQVACLGLGNGARSSVLHVITQSWELGCARHGVLTARF